jgi:hypothetical protein
LFSCFFETFDPSDSSTLLPTQWQLDALHRAYNLGLRPVVRLGQAARNYRYYSDDPSHLHYTKLATQYAAYVAALPLPPSADSLFVGVGNEFNIMGEWRCTEGAGIFLNVSQVCRVFLFTGTCRKFSSVNRPLRSPSKPRASSVTSSPRCALCPAYLSRSCL